MHIRAGERIRVLYPSGRLAYYASPDQARQLIRARLGTSRGNKRQTHSVVLHEGPDRVPTGQHYSYTHESPTNPPNVWELKRIDSADRCVFIMSITDCLVRA